jgi:hypothetical protein
VTRDPIDDAEKDVPEGEGEFPADAPQEVTGNFGEEDHGDVQAEEG